MFFGWSEAVSVCGSCTLAVLWAVGCRLFCLCSFSFCLWFLSFLSLLPPCRVLLRTSCCLVITVWLSPSVIFLCLAEVSCSLHSSAASSTSSCLSLSWFCIAVVFRFFGVILSVRLLFVDLLSFWLSDTPSPLPAVRSPMVQCCACLQFCGWSVGLSPVHVKLCRLVLCCGLSSEWTMYIKLHGFLVWHWLIPTLRMSKCHVEVTLSWNDFPFSKILCVKFSLWTWWNSEWGRDDDSKGVLGLKYPKNHITTCWFCLKSPSSLWMFEQWSGRKCWSS